ncbi:hypothetical protein DPEC_G00243940 [Dallia pectoralis]|uniref:Uncharacterized protein n=1 Tax=Dallia pectoralis TaxID=75939 RepID=A0ACC2FVJ6_DALPE|nr:hypothetical protein DPEC_G00243940 [Dallia pectoralis]
MSSWLTLLRTAIPLVLACLLWDIGMVQTSVCSRWDHSVELDDYALSQEGDVVIGGLIPFHNIRPNPDLSFRLPPHLQSCLNFQGSMLKRAYAIVFAVDEINRNPYLLPGVRLGYRILDSCSQHPWSLRAALTLVSGGDLSCDSTGPANRSDKTPVHARISGNTPVSVVIGDSASTSTIILAKTLRPFGVPVISYEASCACLSDRREFPNFFRTIPSDVYQARTMARLAWRFGWTWVGAIVADNDYGRLAIQVFEEEIRGTEVCLAFYETINRANLEKDAKRAVNAIKGSTAQVIVVFLWYTDTEALFRELVRRNVTNRQFLASEAWSTSVDLLRNPDFFVVARGVLGVAIRSAPIAGFDTFLRSLYTFNRLRDVMLIELWETEFGCRPVNASLLSSAHSPNPSLVSCSGAETLEGVESSFTVASQFRVCYTVYLAVYAAAHALHSLLSCPNRDSPTWVPSSACSVPYDVRPVELLQHLKQVNFTTKMGEVFYFTGADIPAVYDLVNWQATPQGFMKLVTIGRVEGSDLHINESEIQWNTELNTVPASVCNERCPPGTRVASRKGEPVCCFDCVPCAEGEFSNTTGSMQCEHCPLEFWSNNNRTACVPRQLEFLSFSDTTGVTLTIVAVCGALATAAVFVLFVFHRHTPLVQANNSELSFLLLLSLKLCFLCSLVFIGRPSVWACRIRQVNAEFKRITTIPLQSKFMSQLDVYSEKLLKMFQGRGGELGRRLKSVMAPICTSMHPEGSGLDETSKTAIEETTVGIYVIKDHAASVEPEDTGIVLEGVKISYQATCACLSDRREFPNFFRTIPSDMYQARTMARLVWRFGWTWVGAIVADNDYGRLAIQIFEEEIRGTGVCLAFFETINRANQERDAKRAVNVVKSSTAQVIVVIMWYTETTALLRELVRRNVTNRQFLASEAWSTSVDLLRNPDFFVVARGVLGVAIRSAPIAGFEAYLRSLYPTNHLRDVMLMEHWETEFGCRPVTMNASLLSSAHSPNPSLVSCSGAESMEGGESSVTDASQFRVCYTVYLAVYATAHALHSLLSCPNRDSPTWVPSSACSAPYDVRPVELLQHLKRVNFTTKLGEMFYFTGADIPAVYDLVNWQATPQGFLKLVTIGRVEGSDLLINESGIQWNTELNTLYSNSLRQCPRRRTPKAKAIPCRHFIPCQQATAGVGKNIGAGSVAQATSGGSPPFLSY